MPRRRISLRLLIISPLILQDYVLSQDTRQSIKMFTQADHTGTRKTLPDTQGVRIRPAYGQIYNIICQGPKFSKWQKRNDFIIPSILEASRSTTTHRIYQYEVTDASEQWLHFNGFRKSYRGLYECGRGNLQKYVIVENRLPIDREIIFPQRYHTVSIGGTAVMRGYLYGFNFSTDAVEVRWYFEDRLIGANSRFELTTLFHFEYSLSIIDVGANDLGSYTLEAKSRSRVYMDKTFLQSSTRVEIQGAGGSVTVQELSGHVEVCVVLLKFRVGSSMQVTLYSNSSGSAVENVDFQPFEQLLMLDSNSPRSCGQVRILNNGLITGPVPRSFKMSLRGDSDSTGIGISLLDLTVKILDSNALHYVFKQTEFRTRKGGDIMRPCITHTLGTIIHGLTITLYPQAPPGVIPEKLDTFGGGFTLSHTKKESCIRLQAVQDYFIDWEQTIAIGVVKPSYMFIESTVPTMNIIIEQTNGVNFEIFGSFRREIEEGSYNQMPMLQICFGLVNVSSGLRRNAIVTLSTRSISAEGRIDYVTLNTEYIFTRGALVAAQHCAEIYIRGDNLKEEDEIFHVRLSAISPDSFHNGLSTVQVTIKKDSDTGNCRILGELENGVISQNGTHYYDRAYYRCNSGYGNFPWGVLYQVCGGNGWVGETPRCVKVCPQLVVGDGTVKYSNAQGLLLVVDTVAMIQCRPLFRLKGDSVRRCGYTGWSGNPSYCEQITCPPLPNPPNGTVAYDKVLPRSIAVYSCRKGMNPLGVSSNQRMCEDNGEWSDSAPLCVAQQSGSTHPIIYVAGLYCSLLYWILIQSLSY